MKKIYLFLFLFIIFITKTHADETFYLGDHVPDIYIYMDRINKKVYRQFRMIYKSDSNELVYCIEPGTTLANNAYEAYTDYSPVFNLTEDKFNKIKLIAYYGYNYENHNEIKWYAITQYMIWKEVMPDSWNMYFVDKDHNRLDNLYLNEINEINNLVNNHKKNVGINAVYITNNSNSITIIGNKDLNKYSSNIGNIKDDKLIIRDLKHGKNDINLKLSHYDYSTFFYNASGQNLLRRGDVAPFYINSYVYVKGGKIKINECDEETFKSDFVGGSYEVLNNDDEVLSSFSCSDINCISDYLEVGKLKVRVKSLPDKYEVNDRVYDVTVEDDKETELNICSLKKNIKPSLPEKEDNEMVDNSNSITEVVDNNDNRDVVDVPYTKKDTFARIIAAIVLIVLSYYIGYINENN